MAEQQAERIARDFRSDTITIPTEEMFKAMYQASRGDDVYQDDKTTNDFQTRMAKLTGKEAALFAISGTMTNQLGLRTHLHQPPHSVLCDSRAHIHRYEAGGLASHSQAMVLDIKPANGRHLTWAEDILPNLIIASDDPLAIHFCPTRIISLENTLSGTIFPQDEIVKISTEARKLGIKMHLDGARLWEVAAATGLSLEELCRPFDSVSLCLSKGIGAPIGSVLVGETKFIAKARHFRKLFGGGVRQCGLLVAAADYCLDNVMPQMPRVHKLARRLAIGLHVAGYRITMPVQTNMLFMDVTPTGVDINDLMAECDKKGLNLRGARVVLHYQTSDAAIDDFIEVATKIANSQKSKAPGMTDTQTAESKAHANGQFHQTENLNLAQLKSEVKSMGRDKPQTNGYQ